MKKLVMILAAVAWIIGCTPAKVTDTAINAAAETLDFGDQSSSTLTTKAWEALDDRDYPALFAYTNKVIELYGEEGKKMNAGLTDFAPMDKAFDYWALNDVGTSLFIQAEAYVAMKMYPEAARSTGLWPRITSTPSAGTQKAGSGVQPGALDKKQRNTNT